MTTTGAEGTRLTIHCSFAETVEHRTSPRSPKRSGPTRTTCASLCLGSPRRVAWSSTRIDEIVMAHPFSSNTVTVGHHRPARRPATAVLIAAVERKLTGSGLWISAVTADFLGGMPLRTVTITTCVVRAGRRVQLVEATMHADQRSASHRHRRRCDQRAVERSRQSQLAVLPVIDHHHYRPTPTRRLAPPRRPHPHLRRRHRTRPTQRRARPFGTCSQPLLVAPRHTDSPTRQGIPIDGHISAGSPRQRGPRRRPPD
jgi:hypothetical protein